MIRGFGAVAACALLLLVTAAAAEEPAATARPTADDLAKENRLSLSSVGKALKWEEPAEPLKIVGPLHFVGTQGLGAYLFATAEGHVLLNTGMPSSGPMIVDSIRKLGFDPKDVRWLLNGHAHADHAGAFAYLKEQTGASLAVMREDVRAMEDGGKDDFHYGAEWKVMGFPPAEVDRVLRDGDTVRIGDVLLAAHHTPGHTRGSTTWVATVVDAGQVYTVVFPDGLGFNPGYRLAKDPSYPGIGDDYRRTHHALEMLRPDVFLAYHGEQFGLAGKRDRAATEGVAAWVNPEEYRRYVAAAKRRFEDQVDEELGVAPAAR